MTRTSGDRPTQGTAPGRLGADGAEAQGRARRRARRFEQHDREGTLPRGGRGIFYDLRPSGFGRGVRYVKRSEDPSGWWDPSAIDRHRTRSAAARAGRFAPDEAGPDYVQELVADARRAGKLREEWVADDRAPEPLLPDLGPQSAQGWADTFGAWLADAHVTLDRQRGQDRFIESWCEAGALIPRLGRIARDEFHVPVYSGGGYDGLKGKRRAAQRIARRARRDISTVVLLIGDYDDHGRTIRDVYEEDVGAWVTAQHGCDLDVVEFVTVAITDADQAREYDLLDADGKAEADGIPVAVMDDLLRAAIRSAQDPVRRERNAADEAAENERLRDLIERAVDEWRDSA
jgi:hypothetical protein